MHDVQEQSITWNAALLIWWHGWAYNICCLDQALEVRNEELEEQLAEVSERLAAVEADAEAAQGEVDAAQAAAEQAQQDYEELRTRLDAFANTKWELEAKLKEVRHTLAIRMSCHGVMQALDQLSTAKLWHPCTPSSH